MKTLIHGLLFEEIVAAVQELGAPAFRGKQLWQWLYGQRVNAWAAMKNLPADLRLKLEENFALAAVKQLEITGEEGETRKLLAGLGDGDCVEEVLLQSGERTTLERRTSSRSPTNR